MDNWIYICDTSDIDFEDLKRFDYKDKTFCIYNIKDGFFATDGICTHEDVHLEDGFVTDDEIECPMHQGIFNIKTGTVIQDPPCKDLRTYAVKLEKEKIYINIV